MLSASTCYRGHWHLISLSSYPTPHPKIFLASLPTASHSSITLSFLPGHALPFSILFAFLVLLFPSLCFLLFTPTYVVRYSQLRFLPAEDSPICLPRSTRKAFSSITPLGSYELISLRGKTHRLNDEPFLRGKDTLKTRNEELFCVLYFLLSLLSR